MVVLRATSHGGMNCSKKEFARNAKVQHEKEWHLGHGHKCSFLLGGGGSQNHRPRTNTDEWQDGCQMEPQYMVSCVASFALL